MRSTFQSRPRPVSEGGDGILNLAYNCNDLERMKFICDRVALHLPTVSSMPIHRRSICYDPYGESSFRRRPTDRRGHIPKDDSNGHIVVSMDAFTFNPVPKRITSYSSSIVACVSTKMNAQTNRSTSSNNALEEKKVTRVQCRPVLHDSMERIDLFETTADKQTDTRRTKSDLVHISNTASLSKRIVRIDVDDMLLIGQ
jgi:hypothetical protein